MESEGIRNPRNSCAFLKSATPEDSVRLMCSAESKASKYLSAAWIKCCHYIHPFPLRKRYPTHSKGYKYRYSTDQIRKYTNVNSTLSYKNGGAIPAKVEASAHENLYKASEACTAQYFSVKKGYIKSPLTFHRTCMPEYNTMRTLTSVRFQTSISKFIIRLSVELHDVLFEWY